MPSNAIEHSDTLIARRKMIQQQIRDRGVRDPRVLDALMAVPREEFLPPEQRHHAYDDRALALAHGQTISQPYIVAYMTEQLAVEPHHRVLEIGTGSGYQCAILAKIAQHVYSIERIDSLRQRAAETLERIGINNVTLRGGDGTMGLPEFAPYDRIMVTAAGPRVPQVLVDQLAEGGRLVIPIGGALDQTIVVASKSGGRIIETATIGCRFVKLIGQEGWHLEATDLE
jgi:protein-L-isoaspartate(D-aspartate) O-methyltransferase